MKLWYSQVLQDNSLTNHTHFDDTARFSVRAEMCRFVDLCIGFGRMTGPVNAGAVV
jgi:hypothetical protein